ncbi:TonB-linked outer membrane protein, SusC/RagA family [Flavobacterium flevense]|uniref:SusC/RagA family TonB-linked outer membrane protein n=2 Tax=Flavobacterium flevense TaxID=983 RepID=A0A4Y4AWJ9_9FLAO|nr:SusC/RagA family TonB-linked outer membrane protein [Flavobacterium flevense]SHM15282.1 TonB-linked outer membrane protein, SusC/RagA family [Flavobacterium flevense]
MFSVFHGQTLKVSGKVIDDTGFPLPGVSVLIEGTNKGTNTDFEGNYTIPANNNDVLIFSYIGFTTQKNKVSGKVLNVKMISDVANLKEVIVVGYGTQKKESVVGAIAQLDGQELTKRGNLTNLTDALSGSMPGVNVLSSSGIPGGAIDGNYNESQILIRGRSTWNNASPLVLVDGVERTMNDIDPNDVKTVTVLKDASATSIFGVKGGNGVILITTKRGLKGDAQFKVDANISFKSVSKIPRVLEGYTSTVAKNRAIVNGLSVMPVTWGDFTSDEELEYLRSNQYPDAYANRDWANSMLEDYALSKKINASVSGGNDFVKYFGSLGFVTDGDILKTENVGQGYDPDFKYDRFNFRTNLDFTLTKSTKLEVGLNGYYGEQSRSGASVFGFWYGIYSKPWTTPVLQYEDGIYGQGIDYERFGQNGFVDLNFSGVDVTNRGEINTNFKLTQDLDVITKGLKVSGELAFDNFYSSLGNGISDDGVLMKYVDPIYYTLNDPNANIEDYTSYFFPNSFTTSTNGFEFKDLPIVYENSRIDNGSARSVRSRLMYRLTLNYSRKFGVHDVSALGLFSRDNTKNYSVNGWPSKREDWSGRLAYGYDQRYNIELNGSYNGTEKFGPGYKFAFFPSVGLGWTVSNEKFFEKVKKYINNLKFRYSDGIVGNDNANNIGQWPYFTSYVSGGTNGVNGNALNNSSFGDGPLYGGPLIYGEGTIGNPSLRWETARKQNLGIEVGAFDNALTMTLDLFKEHREDILVTANQRNVPDYFGAPAPTANIGITENKGYEFVANYKNNINNFNYWASLNFTFVKDKIIQKEDSQLLPDYQKEAGFQIGQNKSNVSTGIINSWDEMYTGVVGVNNATLLPGDYRLLDYNADGFVDFKDVVPYGYPNRPQATYGFALGGDYKGFSLSFNFYGQYNITQTVALDEFAFNAPAIYQDQLRDTWTPEYNNSNPIYRSLNYGGRAASTGNYTKKDGSMFRLKTAELGYDLPKGMIKKVGLSALRLFVNGNNLLLWTDLPVDIEGQDFNYRNYPVTKQINLGLSATF